MKNTRAEELMAAYLSGNIKAGERKELMQWVDDSSEGRKFFDNAVSLWSITEQMAYPDFSSGKKESWQTINQRINDKVNATTTPTASIRHLNIRRWSAAAAVALLVVAGWWISQNATNTILASTASGERQEVTLPDGTSVWLNENSQLSYELREDERYITFQGEAFFDVATDSLCPFRVYSGQSVTTVLGTSFNLRAYPQEEAVEVSVTEGRVALATQVAETPSAPTVSLNRVELSKGETAILEKETSTIKANAEKATNSTAWKDRRLSFNNVPLSEVVKTLERYYDIDIELGNVGLENCLVRIKETEDPSVDIMMQFLEAIVELNIEQQGQFYRFTGQACN